VPRIAGAKKPGAASEKTKRAARQKAFARFAALTKIAGGTDLRKFLDCFFQKSASRFSFYKDHLVLFTKRHG
jgi:hypothetical protein